MGNHLLEIKHQKNYFMRLYGQCPSSKEEMIAEVHLNSWFFEDYIIIQRTFINIQVAAEHSNLGAQLDQLLSSPGLSHSDYEDMLRRRRRTAGSAVMRHAGKEDDGDNDEGGVSAIKRRRSEEKDLSSSSSLAAQMGLPELPPGLRIEQRKEQVRRTHSLCVLLRLYIVDS